MEKIELVKVCTNGRWVKVYRIRALKSFILVIFNAKKLKKVDWEDMLNICSIVGRRKLLDTLKMLLYMGWLRSKIMLW